MTKRTKEELQALKTSLISKQTELAALNAATNSLDQKLAPALLQEQVELGKKSFKSFFVQAWPYIDPGKPYMDNWHVDCLCEHLEAVTNGEIQNLIIQISPRSSKSSICNVAWPVWSWIKNARAKFITAAAIDKLALRDATRSRTLINSPWFQRAYAEPLGIKLSADTNQKSRYENTQYGYRIATSIAGQGIGEGFDYLVIDDPHKPKEMGKIHRDAVIDWYTGTISTRKNSPKSAKVLIHQRLHQLDLIGWCIKNQPELYEIINIPMEFEPERKFFTSLGWTDPRTEPGEIFWKERWPIEELNALKKDLNPYGTAAQLQQNPVPREGGVIKKDWIKYYTTPYNKYNAGQYELLIGSCDLTFSDTGNSFTVGQVWGKKGPNYYLIDQFRGNMNVVKQLGMIRDMKRNYPNMRTILIEKMANGDAVVAQLQKEIQGLVPIKLSEIGGGDKEVRLALASLAFESGNIYVPHPDTNPWVKEFIEELTTFPRAGNDDQCFLPDTLINTARGLVPIKDVQLDDYVYTHKGNLKKVVNKFRSMQKQLVKVYYEGGLIESVTSTGNHPFLVERNKELNWVKAKDLTKTDYLVDPDKKLKLSAKRKNYSIKKIKKIEFLDVDSEVYNLEIEDDHSYCLADFAVHNCDACSMFINWANQRSGLKALDIRASAADVRKNMQNEKQNFEQLLVFKQQKSEGFIYTSPLNISDRRNIFG